MTSEEARQVVLVTGGAGGIGAVVARRFAAKGDLVVVADRDLAGASDLVSDLPGDGHAPLEVDVASEDSVEAMADSIRSGHGRLGTVVHAAGILGETQPPWTVPTEEWDRIFAINTRGTFLVLRALVPILRAQGSGCVQVIASVAAKEARHNYVAYNASKAAVLNLAWSAALDLAPHGVRVHALCPGPVDTAMWEQVATTTSGSTAEEARAARRAQIPMGRFATPDDIAAVAEFLASPQAAYLTGLSIDIAGGARLGMGT